MSIAILAFQHWAIVLINLVYVVIITNALNLSAPDQFAMLYRAQALGLFHGVAVRRQAAGADGVRVLRTLLN